MIDKLKFLIDSCEYNPKLKSMLLQIAGLPEDKQEQMLDLMELILQKD